MTTFYPRSPWAPMYSVTRALVAAAPWHGLPGSPFASPLPQMCYQVQVCQLRQRIPRWGEKHHSTSPICHAVSLSPYYWCPHYPHLVMLLAPGHYSRLAGGSREHREVHQFRVFWIQRPLPFMCTLSCSRKIQCQNRVLWELDFVQHPISVLAFLIKK